MAAPVGWLLLCGLVLSASGEPAADWRLPKWAEVLHYRVTLLPLLASKEPKLCGHVWIDLIHRDGPERTISLHAANLMVLEAVVEPYHNNQTERRDELERRLEDFCFTGIFHDRDDGPKSVEAIRMHDDGSERLTLTTVRSMERGAAYRLGLFYIGAVYEEFMGFHRLALDDNLDCCPQFMGATQFEAIFARRTFPCFDEPDFKATFDLVVAHQNSLSAVSNMPLQSTEPLLNLVEQSSQLLVGGLKVAISATAASLKENAVLAKHGSHRFVLYAAGHLEKPESHFVFDLWSFTDDWKWSRFERSPMMSTYLVAVVVMPYEYAEQRHKSEFSDVLLRFWYPAGQRHKVSLAMRVAPLVLAEMERYLQQPFALPKVDLVPAPQFGAGAMENWGLIIFRDRNLLVDPETVTDEDEFTATMTIVHEFAHQWFGNLVTSSWWDEIWLNEGMASLFESIILTKTSPEKDWDLYLSVNHIDIMYLDQLPSTRAVGSGVASQDDITQQFDAIAYFKGAGIWRMVRSIIGEQVFRETLITYFDRFLYGNANSSELLTLMNEKAHERRVLHRKMDLRAIASPWIHHKGHPVVRCVRLDNGKLRLSQKAFADVRAPGKATGNGTTTDCRPPSPLWWVQVRLTTSKGTHPSSVWLSPRRPSVETTHPTPTDDVGDWYVVDADRSGFYRVNYDAENWRRLVRQLSADHSVLAPSMRLRLLDDAFSLGHAGIIGYGTAFRLAEYLTSGVDPFILRIVRRHLQLIQHLAGADSLESSLPDAYPILDYVEKLDGSKPLEDSLPRTKFSLMAAADAYLVRSKCDANEPFCTSTAIELFNAVRQDRLTSDQHRVVSKNLETVLCAAIRHGEDVEWDYVWAHSRFSAQWPNRSAVLASLACSRRTQRLKKLLALIFHPDDRLRPAETVVLLRSLADNVHGNQLAVQFLMANWAPIIKLLGRKSAIDLLTDATRYSKSEREVFQMERWLAKPSTSADRATLESLVDRMRDNMELSQRIRDPSTGEWLLYESNSLYK